MNRITYASAFHFFFILKAVDKVNKVQSRIKPLTFHLQSKGGRSKGHIIMPRRGSYVKRAYRYIDFKRIIFPQYKGLALCFIYDPLRSARLCLICYPIGSLTYILQPNKLLRGDIVYNNSLEPSNYGDSALLLNIPSGRLIHNIHGRFSRAAGSSTILVRKDQDHALVKLKSGELRFFHLSLIGSIGTIANENHFLRNLRLAGTTRHLGFRPRTRPSAMNPVDHPMGGRTRGGCQPVNIKGCITLHRRTVYRKRLNILYTKRQLKFLRL